MYNIVVMALKKSTTMDEAISTTSSILKNEPVERAAFFGSFSRGDVSEESDIDILVEPDYDSSFSYLDLVRLERDLSDKLGQKVDLLTFNSLNPHMKDKVNKEAKIFYERQGQGQG